MSLALTPAPALLLAPVRQPAARTAAPELRAFTAPIAPAGREDRGSDVVEEWGLQSFPASDPPANW
ncbi:hypothetical protein JKP75_10080 [Blastococcus sp. TML/M2B]|uniref:hypothetical protein n=1 Tax=unclassified Blastococcus TaxID=2619396 RepID=UPI00190DF3A7|nr:MULTISPECIES: hypothetical protein [unclassified Blastococcus]MBN1092876.1 hypothetical protein [Blastococcus sp. TML/M2B]MBN1097016.1 hypothetical protein [Blastococcus sp. TML/C7B]